MSYTHTVTVSLSYDDAVARTREALAEHGFGVLTEIDIRATFTKKLGQEAADAVGDYVILGACNPGLASKALGAEPEMGALLPCNVVVRRSPGAERTTVETIDPQTMSSSARATRSVRSLRMPMPGCALHSRPSPVPTTSTSRSRH